MDVRETGLSEAGLDAQMRVQGKLAELVDGTGQMMSVLSSITAGLGELSKEQPSVVQPALVRRLSTVKNRWEQRAIHESRKEKVSSLFEELDLDNNGVLSKQELSAGFDRGIVKCDTNPSKVASQTKSKKSEAMSTCTSGVLCKKGLSLVDSVDKLQDKLVKLQRGRLGKMRLEEILILLVRVTSELHAIAKQDKTLIHNDMLLKMLAMVKTVQEALSNHGAKQEESSNPRANLDRSKHLAKCYDQFVRNVVALFDTLDLDGDGKLDYAELAKGFELGLLGRGSRGQKKSSTTEFSQAETLQGKLCDRFSESLALMSPEEIISILSSIAEELVKKEDGHASEVFVKSMSALASTADEYVNACSDKLSEAFGEDKTMNVCIFAGHVTGLRTDGPNLFVVCSYVDGDEWTDLFKTPVCQASTEPIWNHQAQVLGCRPGDRLQFAIYEAEGDDENLVGRSQYVVPEGVADFQGTMNLLDTQGFSATLRLRINESPDLVQVSRESLVERMGSLLDSLMEESQSNEAVAHAVSTGIGKGFLRQLSQDGLSTRSTTPSGSIDDNLHGKMVRLIQQHMQRLDVGEILTILTSIRDALAEREKGAPSRSKLLTEFSKVTSTFSNVVDRTETRKTSRADIDGVLENLFKVLDIHQRSSSTFEEVKRGFAHGLAQLKERSVVQEGSRTSSAVGNLSVKEKSTHRSSDRSSTRKGADQSSTHKASEGTKSKHTQKSKAKSTETRSKQASANENATGSTGVSGSGFPVHSSESSGDSSKNEMPTKSCSKVKKRKSNFSRDEEKSKPAQKAESGGECEADSWMWDGHPTEETDSKSGGTSEDVESSAGVFVQGTAHMCIEELQRVIDVLRSGEYQGLKDILSVLQSVLASMEKHRDGEENDVQAHIVRQIFFLSKIVEDYTSKKLELRDMALTLEMQAKPLSGNDFEEEASRDPSERCPSRLMPLKSIRDEQGCHAGFGYQFAGQVPCQAYGYIPVMPMCNSLTPAICCMGPGQSHFGAVPSCGRAPMFAGPNACGIPQRRNGNGRCCERRSHSRCKGCDSEPSRVTSSFSRASREVSATFSEVNGSTLLDISAVAKALAAASESVCNASKMIVEGVPSCRDD